MSCTDDDERKYWIGEMKKFQRKIVQRIQDYHFSSEVKVDYRPLKKLNKVHYSVNLTKTKDRTAYAKTHFMSDRQWVKGKGELEYCLTASLGCAWKES